VLKHFLKISRHYLFPYLAPLAQPGLSFILLFAGGLEKSQSGQILSRDSQAATLFACARRGQDGRGKRRGNIHIVIAKSWEQPNRVILHGSPEGSDISRPTEFPADSSGTIRRVNPPKIAAFVRADEMLATARELH
jgi:hypothetical protein